MIFKPAKRLASLRASLCSLLVACAGLAFVVPAVTACGPAGKSATGQRPADDAEMKEVVINVFGMT
jgi:hypothetical protein